MTGKFVSLRFLGEEKNVNNDPKREAAKQW
jgi:hypothetical protein